MGASSGAWVRCMRYQGTPSQSEGKALGYRTRVRSHSCAVAAPSRPRIRVHEMQPLCSCWLLSARHETRRHDTHLDGRTLGLIFFTAGK